MVVTVLDAFKELLDHDNTVLTPIFRGNGRANSAGDSLEYFIKDLFCGNTFQYQHQDKKNKEYKKVLSWTGNSTNFPDFIVRGGVGVEPKKINGGNYSSISLNSSFPKDYIYPESQNLPQNIDEGDWDKKPVIYVVGNLYKPNKKISEQIDDDRLTALWFAYGNTFIANEEQYKSIIEQIKSGIKDSLVDSQAELEPSKELGRIKDIDGLKNSNLRIRGMYELKHPGAVFSQYVQGFEDLPENVSKVFLIMLKSDYDSITNKPDFTEYINEGTLIQNDINIPNPNDPDAEVSAVLFEGWTH